jgi:hypothetical protein
MFEFFFGRKGKYIKGSISIMLSIVMVGMMSLSALLMEGGRFQTAKQSLEEETIESAISMLASYHKKLQSKFGIYALDENATGSDQYLDYLMFNSGADPTGDYAGNRISTPYQLLNSQYDPMYDLANSGVLKRQMLENAKYRVPAELAEELLDIDKMIEGMKEKALGSVPELEKLLKTCNAVANLFDAIEKIYNLEKNVQTLQESIGFDKGLIQEGVEGVWQGVDEFITKERWTIANPTYKDSYEKFESAVAEKSEYIRKNNPVPQDPGSPPNADLTTLETDKNEKQKIFGRLTALEELLNIAKNYVDSEGIQDEDDKLLIINPAEIAYFNALEIEVDTTRKELLDKLNGKLEELLGGATNKMQDFRLEDVEIAISAVESKRVGAEIEYNNSASAYDTTNALIEDWKQKKAEYEAFVKKMKSLDDEINKQKENLKSACNIIKSSLSSYESKISNINDALKTANTAVSDLGMTEVKTKEAEGVFVGIQRTLIDAEQDKPKNGIDFLEKQIRDLESFSAADVNGSYDFGTNFPNTGMYDTQKNPAYFLNKGDLIKFMLELESIKIISGVEKIAQMNATFDLFKNLVKIINPDPSTYNDEYIVKLGNDTAGILPSKIRNGQGTKETANIDDIQNVSAILGDAQAMLGGSYQSDINYIEPDKRMEEADLVNELTKTMQDISDAMMELTGNTSMLSADASLVSVVWSLFSIIDNIRIVINGFIFIAQNIKPATELIMANLYENLLLNSYATMTFPNRTTELEKKETITPVNGVSRQTFSGAQVEYIINGKRDEKENQKKVFWSIFMIRALNNIFTVLSDPDAVKIIANCNIFAIIVFPLWVYLESNVDMNLLIEIGQEVPLIKSGLILSPSGLSDAASHLSRMIKDTAKNKGDLETLNMRLDLTTKELIGVEGFINFSYEDYLWLFMFFMPNHTKVMRMADLMQMEVRYAEPEKNFLMKNANTFMRVENSAKFVSILPIISLGSETINDRKITIKSTKYIGY